MTKEEVSKWFDIIDEECSRLRNSGQKEYAGENEDAFTNFKKLEAELNIPKEAVLWIYAMKHKDGIASHIRGYISQREDVRGRINDLIVYLKLLRCMIEEEKNEKIP